MWAKKIVRSASTEVSRILQMKLLSTFKSFTSLIKYVHTNSVSRIISICNNPMIYYIKLARKRTIPLVIKQRRKCTCVSMLLKRDIKLWLHALLCWILQKCFCYGDEHKTTRDQVAREGMWRNKHCIEMLMLWDVWMVLYGPHGTHISRFLPKHCVFMSSLSVCDFGQSEILSFDTLIRLKN